MLCGVPQVRNAMSGELFRSRPIPCQRCDAVGMTLLELLVACSILVVLSTVAMPMARVTVKRHRELELRDDLRQMRDAIDRYKDDADKNLLLVQAGTEGYPPDLETLVTGAKLNGVQDKTTQLPPKKSGRSAHGRHGLGPPLGAG
jgi:general secretion pathway protein G